jgi:hypothetical protein
MLEELNFLQLCGPFGIVQFFKKLGLTQKEVLQEHWYILLDFLKFHHIYEKIQGFVARSVIALYMPL